MALALFLALPIARPCRADPAVSRQITGAVFEYEVRSGDSLVAIGARFGVGASSLARDNKLSVGARLRVGQRLLIDNRHIVPDTWGSEIVINVPQRMLFHFRGDRLEAAYPVGLGRPDWQTPSGHFEVASREENKAWIVPKSIQEEMLRQGEPVLTFVPPGPTNPLGRHWLGLSFGSLGIHGTIAPASVYAFQSHGCIRLHPDDIATLFAAVNVGAVGEIIYEPLLLANPDGVNVYAEVHADVYRKRGDAMAALRRLATSAGLAADIDWGKAAAALAQADGRPQDISLRTGGEAAAPSEP